MLNYNLGARHPLKPERLRRAVELLKRYGVEPVDPGAGDVKDVLRLHAPDYVDAVRELSLDPTDPIGDDYGLSGGDTPAFEGIYEASLAYVAGTARAAEEVRDGSRLAFGLGGGLHHAHRARASGFCVFDDPAIACHILRERFDRVAYVDIDVHHGDGVQGLFAKDPTVLTCSIHQTPQTLFPGTGFAWETGPGNSIVNVPVDPRTHGEEWLEMFREGIMSALFRFNPQAVVLQMGADAHYLDPLANLLVSQACWLEAVADIGALDLPTVAVGGGGYEITTVPRMWASAVLTLMEIPFADELPRDLAEAWGTPTFSD
ncbi:MAG: acetoin utilization protein AcuC [Fimbriimonas sp.]